MQDAIWATVRRHLKSVKVVAKTTLENDEGSTLRCERCSSVASNAPLQLNGRTAQPRSIERIFGRGLDERLTKSNLRSTNSDRPLTFRYLKGAVQNLVRLSALDRLLGPSRN